MATVNKLGGISSGNRFVVQITPPPSLLADARTLTFLCNSISLPGFLFLTEDVRSKGYGLVEKRLSGVDFDDLSLTFMCDNKGFVINFFNKWGQIMSSFDPAHANKLVDGMSIETINYPEDYQATVTIYVQDPAGNNYLVYTLYNSQLLNISPPVLAWDQNDQVTLLQVTLAFRTFSTAQTAAMESTENTSLSTNAVNTLAQGHLQEVLSAN